MHHADAKFVKDPDEPQFVAHALPPLAQRNAVAGETKAGMSGLLERRNLVRRGDLGQVRLHQIGRMREVREPFDQPQRIVPLLSSILENAGDPGGVKGIEELPALAFIDCAPIHHHAFAQIIEFVARCAVLDGLIDAVRINGKARREAIGLKHHGAKVELPGMLELRLRGLQDAHRNLARPVDGRVSGQPD